MDSTPQTLQPPSVGPGSVQDVTSRIERLPLSKWQVKARILIGTATFFDAFDALTIAQVMPVLVTAWALNGGQVGLLISVGYLGQLVGALFFSWIAERYGRVPAMVASIITFASMSILCALAWNFESLLIFRTIQGLGLGGQVPIAAVYISEMTKAHGRGKFVLVYELIFSIGVVAAGVVGYWVVPNLGWHYMFIIGAAPILMVYAIRTWLPESPRWLSSKGHAERADKSMSLIEAKVEKATGRPLPEPAKSLTLPVRNVKTNWAEIFRHPYLKRTLVVWLMWFAAYLVYYGIGTWLPTLYRTVFNLPLEESLRYGLISNAIGFVGAAVCAFSIDYVGRKTWFAFALAGTAVFLGLLALTGAKTPLDVLIYGSGAYFFAAAVAIGLYLYTPELYPTRVRALGVGTATAWLRLASMAGPVIVGTLITFGLASVFTIFAVVAVIAATVVAIFALETKERVLEQLSP